MGILLWVIIYLLLGVLVVQERCEYDSVFNIKVNKNFNVYIINIVFWLPKIINYLYNILK